MPIWFIISVVAVTVIPLVIAVGILLRNEQKTNDKPTICHACASQFLDRNAFFNLIYKPDGYYICDKCRKPFSIHKELK